MLEGVHLGDHLKTWPHMGLESEFIPAMGCGNPQDSHIIGPK